MILEHPVAARYVSRLDAILTNLEFSERAEIVEEIRNHIAESHASGKSLDHILASLGSAEHLASAYAAELLLNPRNTGRRKFGQWFKIGMIVAASTVTTFVMIIGLGSFGISLTASGVVIFLISALEAANIHVPGVQMNGVSPAAGMALSPVLFVLGIVSLATLRLYLQFLRGTLKTLLPRGRTAFRVA